MAPFVYSCSYMRITNLDQYEAIDLLASLNATEVKERLGLKESERTIQRWAARVYGSIPTRRELARPNPERNALVLRMESEGLDRRYCVHQHHSFYLCLIRLTDVGHVFVCRKHALRGDW